MRIRTLGPSDLDSPAFRHLLWLAVEVDDHALQEIIDTRLPRLTNVGIFDGDGVVVGFVAYDPDTRPLTIEYIASAPEQRGRGVGESLVREVRLRHPDTDVFAETDDDAIGFYRRLGFADTPAPRDARWPDRERYACVLRAAGHATGGDATGGNGTGGDATRGDATGGDATGATGAADAFGYPLEIAPDGRFLPPRHLSPDAPEEHRVRNAEAYARYQERFATAFRARRSP